MIIGYGHLPAPADQAAIAALRQSLTEAGAEAVFVEAAPPPGQGNGWPALDCALASAGTGDVLLALSPAHLARSVADLLQIADRIAARGGSLRVMNVAGGMMLDTATQTGATMLAAIGLLSAFGDAGAGGLFAPAPREHAAFDPAAEGLQPRRQRGRPPTASTQAVEIARLRAAGMRATDIADRLKICRASVYRVLNMTTAGSDNAARLSQPKPAPARPATPVPAAQLFPPVARRFSLHRS
jgi:DNA invertase Pin-like site-specific DNA recombinase